MSIRDAFHPVSKTTPCPICSKPDWCLLSREGGDNPVSALCQRVESKQRWGGAGWFHRLRDSHRDRRWPRGSIELTPAGRDFTDLAREFAEKCPLVRREQLARHLVVSVASLARLGLGWDDRAFTFPMEDGLGRVRGIRRRFYSGDQCCITGSKNGIFVPSGLRGSGPLLVCEGASDTAAVLDLGFDAIGRPDCQTGWKQVVRHVRRHRPEAVVVFADNDLVGRQGAVKLARIVAQHCAHVRVIAPPDGIKDAREWKCRGATATAVGQAILYSPEVVLLARHCRIGGGR